MKYTDLEGKTLQELEALLKEKKQELFTLRVKLKTMQLTNTSEVRATRKDIARIQTAINATRSK
jgi:large subunit ribosomal protein L29